jgi:hyperosmotically inducible protein
MRFNPLGISLTVAFAFLATAPIWMNTPGSFASSSIQEVTEQSDRQIQADVTQELSRNRFKEVQVSVNNGVVDLKGSVQLVADKDEAEKKARRTKKAIAVRNEIRVATVQMSDEEIKASLVKKLEYDRVGYGTTTFNAISVGVRDGAVTLGGHAYSPTDKSSALSVASYTPGVQDVIDEIDVDPVSPMDDMVRIRVARLVYGYPALFKYSIDPGRPIRISVQNGHVTLFGVVDTEADRDTARIRANSAQGVFSVTNELQVVNASSERN